VTTPQSAQPVICFLLFVLSCSQHPSSEVEQSDMSSIEDVSSDGLQSGDVFDQEEAVTCQTLHCETGTYCFEGSCETAAPCVSPQSWKECLEPLAAVSEELQERATCVDGYCVPSCQTDDHCKRGSECTNFGRCVPFDGFLEPSAMSAEEGPLRAGFGQSLLRVPIGTSLAGYGSRASGGTGRYAKALSASHGQMHGLDAQAIALDNGVRRLILMRIETVFPTMSLHEAVARRLQERTGKDWRDGLVISATHTHSGPARFFYLPDELGIDAGSLGTGAFHEQIFEWLADSMADAAEAALDDLQDARLGWRIVEDFDGDDEIAGDRWSQTPSFDDNRLLLIRIDDDEGNPLANLVSFGAHGTIHGDEFFTGDATSGVERGMERALARQFGRTVPVLFFNENGGTMSPRGDRHGHLDAHRWELMGERFAERALPPFANIETSSSVALSSRTHRFPITYERVGYELGEWTMTGVSSWQESLFYGGINCLLGDDEDPSTHATPYDFFCLPIHLVTYNRPPTLFLKSQITALDLAGLTVVTLPGEASMELGWQIVRALRDRQNIPVDRSFVWGYAQDHQFYLLPTNLRGERPSFPGISLEGAPDDYPDFAFSWLQGGYEPTVSTWGYKFGDFLIERAVEAVGLMGGQPLLVPDTYPVTFSSLGHTPFPIDETPSEMAGRVTQEVPAEVHRLTPIEFAWIGGDPGAEMPQAPRVILERKSGDTFDAAQTPALRIYDNRSYTMLTRLRTHPEGYEWVVYWEETKDFPLGEYRFRVEGHYLGPDQNLTPYVATSSVFAFRGAAIEGTIEIQNTQISGEIFYLGTDPLSFEETDTDPAKVRGSYRLRHPQVPTRQPVPVAIEDIDPQTLIVRVIRGGSTAETFSGSEVTLSATTAMRGGYSVPITRYSVPITDGANIERVEISLEDGFGNRGDIVN
jgi:hypothetical protein